MNLDERMAYYKNTYATEEMISTTTPKVAKKKNPVQKREKVVSKPQAKPKTKVEPIIVEQKKESKEKKGGFLTRIFGRKK